jgi:hypothetical protein
MKDTKGVKYNCRASGAEYNWKQAIEIYMVMSSQGMSWKVHFEFTYGHIKTHPYFLCENENWLVFVKKICNNT